MRYGQIKQLIEDGDYDAYTDRVDVTIEISLLEYGIIRNPKTNECIFCITRTCEWEMEDDDKSIELQHRDISIDDMKEYLEEWASDGFFSFIGSDKQKELDQLDNNFAHLIQSITMYDGYFTN